MKSILLFVILLFISCNTNPKWQKNEFKIDDVVAGIKKNEKITFVFDFDETIITDAVLLEAINVASGNNSEKIKQIMASIHKNKVADKPVIHKIMNEIEIIIGRKITIQDFDKTYHNLLPKITPGLQNVIQKIHKSGNKVIIIGGAYSTCGVLSKLAKQLNINSNDIFSGSDSFDNNGNLFYDANKSGYYNCKINQKITNDWIKSDAIKFLKNQNTIKGSVIHIGDGENDLEVWKSNEADIFIGFGVNKIKAKVAKEAPVFVKNIDEFDMIIKKIIQ